MDKPLPHPTLGKPPSPIHGFFCILSRCNAHQHCFYPQSLAPPAENYPKDEVRHPSLLLNDPLKLLSLAVFFDVIRIHWTTIICQGAKRQNSDIPPKDEDLMTSLGCNCTHLFIIYHILHQCLDHKATQIPSPHEFYPKRLSPFPGNISYTIEVPGYNESHTILDKLGVLKGKNTETFLTAFLFIYFRCHVHISS
ncbi:hypothetical protein Cgig2_001562 [Carnegiea gigantea]|uniref:Uncharacterized protein n=1 Tax=Carnegiea gigantea TaxID=171969 RepID=A0A9Q1K0I2_9CARY|nr:hypothetical protein Cgig2_001562 [Carnegiea gigantea]